MGITSGGGGTGIQILTAAKNGTCGSGSTSTTIVFDTTIGTNNGQLIGGATFAGRLVVVRRGTATEETRYMISDDGNLTATVSEPWDVVPTNSDSYDICYIVDDVTNVTGFGVINKRVNDYAATRRIRVGDEASPTFAWFALLNGSSIETNGNGSTTVSDFIVLDQARFDSGYLLDGVAVQGGAMFFPNATAGVDDGDLVFEGQTGSLVNLYDFFCKSVNNYSIDFNGNSEIVRAKTSGASYTSDFAGSGLVLRDCILDGLRTTNETILLESTSDLDTFNLVNTNGFISNDDAVDETITVRNGTFVGNLRLVLVQNDKKWNFVNPVWSVDISDQGDIEFENGTNNEVREQYSFNGTVTDSAAADVSGVMFHIYESGVNNIQHEGFTNVSGQFNVDIDKFIYTDNAGTSLTRDEKIGFTLKVYDYGFQPALLPLTVDQAIVQPLTLPVDTIITEPTHQSGIKNGPANPIPQKHGDSVNGVHPNPIKVFHYDGGTGGVPTVGEFIENASQTVSGQLVEYIGDAVEGTIVMSGWNGQDLVDNAVVQGTTSSFSAFFDTFGGASSFDSTYTWLFDCQNEPITVVYDNIVAHLANLRHPYVYSFNNTGSVYTDFTAEAITPPSGSQGDVVALPNTSAAINDATYFGALVPFNAISGIVNTTQGPSHTGIWEYWNGSSWATLTSDFDNFYASNTVGEATWSVPSAWEANDDPGVGFDLFWARYRTTVAEPLSFTVQRFYQVFVDKVYEELVKWGQGEYALPLTLGADGWQTFRNVKNNEGVWLANRGAGTIDFLTSDTGATFTPPQSFSFTITGLEPNTEVRIYNSLTREELAGVENSTTSFTYNYQYGGSDVPIFVNIHNLQYEWFRLGEADSANSSFQLSNADQTIPVQQRFDRNFENP